VRRLLRPLAMLAGSLLAVGLMAGSALAATIVDPPGPAFVVPNDASGNPDSFNVQLSGFPADTNILLVQCDGVDPSTPGWAPGVHCDFNTSPPAKKTDGSGNLTIPAHTGFSLVPLRGELQGFNCLAPGGPPSNNGQTDYTNCQLRADTTLGRVSANQVFRTLTLQPASSGGEVPEVPIVAILPIAGLLAGGGYYLIRRRRTAQAAAA
jgi:hypothetical protein